jgi:CCR4-NOT complex subunit CAF16
MPLHPVVGRPTSLAAPGTSLATHLAAAELPTDGPFARAAGKAAAPAAAPAVDAAAAPPAGEAAAAAAAPPGEQPAIAVRGLSFCYPDIGAERERGGWHASLGPLTRRANPPDPPFPDGRPLAGVPPVVTDLHLSLPPGSRTLLLGANGAGKTTLLRVLGGQHMVAKGAVTVLGGSPFHDVHLASSGLLSYLGGNWEREVAFAGYAVPLAADVPAGEMLSRAPGGTPERVAELIRVLDIDPTWRMHRVSDGQRRRVQIAMGLAREFKILLLDEITVDLDVLGRADLMAYLIKECDVRGATIVYATHIFDGLDAWPTHVAFLARGQMRQFCEAKELPQLAAGRLLEQVTDWLRAENAAAAVAEAEAGPAAKHGADPAAWSNGYAAGRMTSTLRGASNAVMRM